MLVVPARASASSGSSLSFLCLSYGDDEENDGAILVLSPLMSPMAKILTYSTSYTGSGAYQKMNINQSVTKLESAAMQRIEVALLDHRRELTESLKCADPESKGIIKAIDWAKIMNDVVPIRLPWLHLKEKFVDAVPGDESSVQYSCLLVKLDSAFAKHGDADYHENLYRMRHEFSKLFRILDSDGSGLLDREEFLKGCDLINSLKNERIFNTDDVDKFMKHLDVNGDGRISFVEFTEGLMSSHHEHTAATSPTSESAGSGTEY